MYYGDTMSLSTVLAEGSFGMDFKIRIKRDIYSRFNAGNSCLHSVQCLLSYSLLSTNKKIKICRNIILPVLLYGCETWFLRLREHKLSVFENRVLMKEFRPEMDDVTQEWRRLHKEEVYGLCSPNIIQRSNKK